MSEKGEIYTAGKNFTLPPALTAWTNSTSESWAVACCELHIKQNYMDVIAPYIGGSATHTPLQQHNEVQMQGKCLFLIFSWGIDQPRSFLATLGAPKLLGLN